MARRKVVGGSAREFLFMVPFSVDIASGDIHAYTYKADSGPSVLTSCGIGTHSGNGNYACRLQTTSVTAAESWWVRWEAEYGTLADGSAGTYIKTKPFELVLEGEDE